MRKTNIFGAAILAVTTAAWSLDAVAQAPAPAPAPAAAPSDSPAPAADSSAPAKKPVHHTHKASTKPAKTTKGDAAVEDLNDASLKAAKDGKAFSAPTAAPAPAKAKPAKASHKKAAKKAAAPAPDASAPAPAAGK